MPYSKLGGFGCEKPKKLMSESRNGFPVRGKKGGDTNKGNGI